MFDIFYIGDNNDIKDTFPFAKQIDTVDNATPKTKMYWLLEPNIEIVDMEVLDFRPPEHDQQYEHIWKWDNSNYGGLRLLPAASSDGVKRVNKIACKKKFDILYTKTPGKYFEKNAYATHVWCVDKEYKLDNSIEWAPSNFEPDFIHSFHLRGQLEHKYPSAEGGIKLYPRDWKKADVKYHTFLDATAKYPVMFVDDPEDYAQRDIHSDEYVWLIDKEHRVDPNSIDWVPDPFARDFIHSFRMPNQLQEKTWSFKHSAPDKRLGGIRLVPKNWKKAYDLIDNGVVIHKDCPVSDEAYDVYYIDDDEFTVDTYQDLAERSKTEWFWVVDREYDFNGKLLFIPQAHELEYIHVFKVPGMLEDRYPVDVEEPWDNRCGGVRLLNKNFDITKHKYQADVVPVKYDIFYTDNPKQYETYARKSKTKMFWLIDNEYQLDNNFTTVVPKHEQKFMLNFQVDQLQHKYPENEGGIYLVPRNANDGTQIKYKGNMGKVSVTKYPVLQVKDVNNFGEINEDSWVVDEEYQIDDSIEWTPGVFEKNSIHTFHVKGQLLHKYPEEMGGVRWVPTVWDGNYVIHNEPLNIARKFPVKRVDDVSDITVVTHDCWLIDKEYQVEDPTGWVPSLFEKNSIHTFHIEGQLKDKYPEEMGGVRWVPAKWNEQYVIHESLDNIQKTYPVKFVDDPSIAPEFDKPQWQVDKQYMVHDNINWIPGDFDKDKVHVFHVHDQLTNKYTESMGGVYWWPGNQHEYEVKIHEKPLRLTVDSYPVYFVDDPADFSTVTEECWLVDKEYELNDTLAVIPWQNELERNMVHVFHVAGQLNHKYPESMGGVYWVPEQADHAEINVHAEPLNIDKQYPVHFVDNPADYSWVTEDCWLVDKEYEIDPNITHLPWGSWADKWHAEAERKLVHVYHVKGQLLHKYPESMGGVYWVPKQHADAEIKIHDTTPFGNSLQFDIFTSESKGRKDSTTGWFWVIDPNVEVLPEFDFNFVPEVWDAGQAHVWQKLNPISGRQYDYDGVRLCPKEFDPKKKRPKFIREHACTQKVFPALYIDPQQDVIEQLTKFDEECTNAMYWAIDPYTQIADDFEFDYYPTQWDVHNVHVFSDDAGEFRNIRLYPKGTFDDMSVYTDKDIANNTFGNLKQINTVASKKPDWPVVYLADVSKDDFVAKLKGFAAQGYDFVWSIDTDVEPVQDIIDRGYMPDILSSTKIHTWQRGNPATGMVHSYGGLRLWPTKRSYDDMTSDALKLNRFKQLQYVKEIGSSYKPFEVVFLSYKEPNAEASYNALCEKTDAHWVKDVEGIFEAHKEAAKQANSKMFWVVDADADVVEDFDFSYIPDPYDQEVVHVWNSKNPVTGHEYGYGGVKLFNTQQVLDATSWGLDFTTGLSNRFKAMPDISCVTRFNTDEYSTWRSAFREAVKLAKNGDEESKIRLQGWLYPMPGAEYREYAKAGAEAGVAYAEECANKPMKLAKINDYEWLEKHFDKVKPDNNA